MTNPLFWILWAAMFSSLAIYAALPWLLPAPAGTPDAPSLVAVGAALGYATVVALASLVVRSVALHRRARAGRLDIARPDGARHWLRVSLVLWALADSIALAGLVLWWLYREPGLLFPFLAGAALLFVVHAPRASSLMRTHSSRDLARSGVKIG